MVAGLQRLRIGRSREMATTVTVEQDGSDGLKQRWQRCKEARSCLSGLKTRWHRWTRRGPGTTVLDPQLREEVIFFVAEEEMKLVQLQAADEALICHGCDVHDLYDLFSFGRSLIPNCVRTLAESGPSRLGRVLRLGLVGWPRLTLGRLGGDLSVL
ncbi:hypothetical protein GW17_00049378 [Ensete ventricosum]|nr:hypothetical protein GW17_00049378 [Ensete ventricosum]RZR85657.1 hypothetical protein BHM03_00012676 [Ensete ventricosum]